MNTVIFERVQLCEIVYSEKDLDEFKSNNPDAQDHDYFSYLMNLISDQDEAWTSAEIFVIGHIESNKE